MENEERRTENAPNAPSRVETLMHDGYQGRSAFALRSQELACTYSLAYLVAYLVGLLGWLAWLAGLVVGWVVGGEGVGGGKRPTDQANFSAHEQLQAHLHANIVSLTELFCLEFASFYHQ